MKLPVKSTFHSCTRYWEAVASLSRVARPMATTTVQLASSDMNPVPITVSNSATDGIDEQVVSQGAGTGGPICYYHRNHQYSVTAVTTSTGTIAERYAYTGREWDATLGLYHFWARWMSPIVGRFVNRDPTSYKGSPFDLYEYARASALKRVDPTGLSWLSSCACFLCYGPIARHVRDLFGSWGYPTHENEKGYDAFLHCLIACEINRTCPQCNNEWDARENSQVVDGQQDLANNLSGRRIVGACFTGCENLWKNGKLTCQKNGSLMPCPSPPPPNQVDL